MGDPEFIEFHRSHYDLLRRVVCLSEPGLDDATAKSTICGTPIPCPGLVLLWSSICRVHMKVSAWKVGGTVADGKGDGKGVRMNCLTRADNVLSHCVRLRFAPACKL